MTRCIREAVVLAGGLGTRLAHLVPDVCKPMAPVAGRPFLRYVLDQLAAEGFRRAVIADGYRREQIESFFGAFYRGLEIVYSPENSPLGTGGAVRRALSLCKGEAAFVLNGDTYLDCDFGAMEASLVKGVDAVLAVKRLRDFDRYGTIGLAPDGSIDAFTEKRPCADGIINAGVYLVRTSALSAMPERFSLELAWLEPLAGTGRLRAVSCDGLFIDIGVPGDYMRAQSLLASRAGGWRLALFDRDGTLNVDKVHTYRVEDLEIVEPMVSIVRRYSEDGAYKVVVVTNQAGIAKGLYGVDEMNAFNEALVSALLARGCRVDAFYHCPHHPDVTGPCACRKPAPGMLLAAIRDFDADPGECVMYGDSETDRLAATAAGIRFEWARSL